jgi:hypothetical protein
LQVLLFSGLSVRFETSLGNAKISSSRRYFSAVLYYSGNAIRAAAVVGAIILAFHAAPEILANSATFHFGRGLAYGMINIYVVKTASVFMITTSTIGLYTARTPRRLALGGYAIAAALLIGSYFFDWSLLVFPVWVLLISVSILADENVVTKARNP